MLSNTIQGFKQRPSTVLMYCTLEFRGSIDLCYVSSPSLIYPSLNVFTIFFQQPQSPQTESWMFTGRITLILAAWVSNTQLNKLQIKDVQGKQMFVRKESPKVLCRQCRDIYAIYCTAKYNSVKRSLSSSYCFYIGAAFKIIGSERGSEKDLKVPSWLDP